MRSSTRRRFILNHHAADLAEKLIEEAPNGLDRVFFTNSGSEANELAFLAARQATGETMVVNLRHSYHGGTSRSPCRLRPQHLAF